MREIDGVCFLTSLYRHCNLLSCSTLSNTVTPLIVAQHRSVSHMTPPLLKDRPQSLLHITDSLQLDDAAAAPCRTSPSVCTVNHFSRHAAVVQGATHNCICAKSRTYVFSHRYIYICMCMRECVLQPAIFSRE